MVDNGYPNLKSVRYLVFEGGGVRGIAYLGAIERLYQSISPAAIRGAGGSSAGAITALIVSFGLDAKQIVEIADSLDFSKVPQRPSASDFPQLTLAEKAALEAASVVFGRDIWSIYGLYHDYGWYVSDYFYGWLKDKIGEQLGSDGTETFAQYKAAMEAKLGRYIDLRVHATDVSGQETMVLSYGTSPDLEVATAVRASMSIPLFFATVRLDGKVLCDGGVIANYPIDVFRDSGSRVETLGFHLCTPEGPCPGSDFPKNDPPAPPKVCTPPPPIKGLRSYFESLFQSMLVPASEVHPEDVDRTIQISSYCVNATGFGIARGTADYNGLFNNGYNAVDRFLTSYDPSRMSCG